MNAEKSDSHRPSAIAWLIGVLLGVLILFGLLLLLIDIFDRQLIAEPLASQVEERTGRSLTMDRFDLRWGWPLTFRAENLALANADWGRNEPMFQVELATVIVNPTQLLSGPPYARVFLQAPRILVEQSDQGQWNWVMDMAASEAPRSESNPSLPLSLQAEGGAIVYMQGDSAAPLQVDLQSLSVAPPPDSVAARAELQATIGDMPLALQADVAFAPPLWEGQGAISAGESTLAFEFSADTDAAPMTIRAAIESELLAPMEIARWLPESEAPSVQTATLPNLEGINAEVDITVAALQLPTVTVNDIAAAFVIDAGQAELDFGANLGDANMRARARIDSTAPMPVLQVQYDLERQLLSAFPESLVPPDAAGEVGASVTAQVEMPDSQVPMTAEALLGNVAVPEGRLVYAFNASTANAPGTELTAMLELPSTGAEPRITLQRQGLEPPLEAVVTLPPLSEQPLHYDGGRWLLEGFEVAYGENRLSGDIVYDSSGELPFVSLDASSPRLNVNDFLLIAGEGEPSDGEDGQSSTNDGAPDTWLSADLAETLRSFNAGLMLEVGQLIMPPGVPAVSDALVAATLNVGLLTVDTLNFGMVGGRINASLTAAVGEVPLEGRISLQAEDIALSELGDTYTPLEEHLGLVSGEVNLAFAERAADEVSVGSRKQLPTLGELSLDDSSLHFRDDAVGTDMTMEISRDDPASGGVPILLVDGAGAYRGEAVSLDLRADPLLTLRTTGDPYELALDFQMAGTRIALDGQVTDPLALQAARFDFEVSGEDTSRLEELFGDLFLASLPPYRVSGAMNYEDGNLSVRGLDGRLGESDIHGDLSVAISDEGPPDIDADLWSDRMDLDDFAGIVGGVPETGPGETASPEQEQAAAAQAQDDRVLPDAIFDPRALERVNADISYSVASIEAGIPVEDLEMVLALQDGRLAAESISFQAGNGRVDLRLDMQPWEDDLAGVMVVDARGVNLASVLENLEFAQRSFGVIGGQGKFWMNGNSVASLLASLDGGVLLMMTGGALDALLVEAAGLDIGEVILVATSLAGPVPIDCAYASIHSVSGAMTIDRFIIDTSDTTFFLEGGLDLGEESLDLTLYPEAKDPGFPAADSPLGIGGTFRQPEVQLVTEDLIARAASAVALSALVGPAAALLPFVEVGDTEEPAICQGWIDRLSEESTDASVQSTSASEESFDAS